MEWDDEGQEQPYALEPPNLQERTYALVALAEQQQKAVQAAVDALVIERDRLVRERGNLAAAVAKAGENLTDAVARAEKNLASTVATAVKGVAGLTEAVAASAAAAAWKIGDTAGEAAAQSVERALHDASMIVTGAAADATAPVVEKLLSSTEALGAAEAKLVTAGQWFAWQVFALAAFCVLLVAGVAWAAVGWQVYEMKELNQERQALAADVAEMKVNAEALASKGARIKLHDCGGRVCIEASANQDGKSANWRGPWANDNNSVQLVIPQGY